MTIKLAVAGAMLAAGAANAATINTLPEASTGSSLVLMLKDNTANTFFVQDLGVYVKDVKTIASAQADGAAQYSLDGLSVNGPLVVPSALSGYTSANLQSYVTAGAGHNITWTILGATRPSQGGGTGDQLMLTTSAANLIDSYVQGTDPGGAAGAMSAFLSDDINAGDHPFVNGVSTVAGWGDANQGVFAVNAFLGASVPTGAALGSAQSLYVLANTDSTTGLAANVYKSLGTLTLNTNGTFSVYTAGDLGGGNPPPVPLPAAVWLLGSGLAGLAGIGRRRKLAAA